MDEICIFLERLLLWVDQNGAPAIPFAGVATGRFFNPPAPHLELAYLETGHYRDLRIGDRQAALGAGQLSIHNVHFGNYSRAPTGRTRGWCIFFDLGRAKISERLALAPWGEVVTVQQQDRMAAAFETVCTNCQRFGPGGIGYFDPTPAYDPDDARNDSDTAAFHMKAAVLELTALLLDEFHAARTNNGAPRSQAVLQAMEFIGLHFADSALRLPEIASAASLSIDHFGRLFREETGDTPMRYLKRLRINHARLLLEHTGLRVDEIAEQVGFTDPFHFSREFRRITGVAPTRYRDHQQVGMAQD